MAKTIKKIIALALSFLCEAIAGMSLTVVNTKLSRENQGVEVNHNDQLSFGGFFGNGITLTASAEETVASTDSVRLTATLLPEETTVSRNVSWSVAWKDPSSTWANGKTVTDYVSLTPTSSGALTADLKCLQAFGEQIIVTVTSDYNPELTATCNVDYVQKVTSASLSFGNIAINLGGSTAVKYEIAKGVTGPGGAVQATVETSDTYTIAEDFTYSVQLTSYADYVGTGDIFSLKDSAITGRAFQINTEYYGEEIYFDYDHDIIDWFIMARAGDICFDELSTAEIEEYFSDITTPGLYQVNFTITGAYNTYTYTSQVYCTGYTNNASLTTLSVDYTKVAF